VVQLTQIHNLSKSISLILLEVLRKAWNNGIMINIYLVSWPIFHHKVLLREISAFGLKLLAAWGRPVGPTGLTGLARQLPVYPPHHG